MRGFVTDPTADGGLRFADDLPEPSPAPDEVVVEVGAFGINRGELFLLRQRDDGWRPGQDVAGVVVAAADDGGGPPTGTRVVAVVDGAGWSERVAVPSHHVAPLADGVGVAQAATLPIAGLTALRALRLGGAVLGRDVLVTGATGAVGSLAVQLAAAAGARVTAHVSGPQRREQAEALGVDAVVWDLEDAGPFHLVLDGVGGHVLRAAVEHLVGGGTAVTYGTMAGAAELGLDAFRPAPMAKVIGFFHYLPEETKGEDLAILAGLVADGRLRPHIGVERDWGELRDVLALLADKEVRGKAVLTVG